jgi:outer membrane protein assembly factor BamB
VVVAKGRALTLFSDGEDDVLAAFEAATGRELWRYRIGERYPAVGSSFDGPLSTPVVAGDRGYALGPRGRVFALSLSDGRELWTWQPEEARRPYFGFSTNPLLVAGVLVVQTGSAGSSAVVGLDAMSGEQRWQLGEDTVQYQSPAAMELADRELVVTVSDHWLFGVEPASGEILWRH